LRTRTLRPRRCCSQQQPGRESTSGQAGRSVLQRKSVHHAGRQRRRRAATKPCRILRGNARYIPGKSTIIANEHAAGRRPCAMPTRLYTTADKRLDHRPFNNRPAMEPCSATASAQLRLRKKFNWLASIGNDRTSAPPGINRRSSDRSRPRAAKSIVAAAGARRTPRSCQDVERAHRHEIQR